MNKLQDIPPKELCLMLDYQARIDLRNACKRGFINRVQQKQRGVKLLQLLGLISLTKTLKTMYRYEPTQLGHEVSKFLPSSNAEWNHTMDHQDLVYGDGSRVPYGNVPRYPYIRDYEKFIWSLKLSRVKTNRKVQT